jgi:hypothetical protein
MGNSATCERDIIIMKSTILWFIAAVITGGLLLVTFAPVNEMSVVSQNTSQMLAVTSNTSSYVSATGDVGRYQDAQVFLVSNAWWIICITLILIIVVSAGQIGKGDNNGQ